MLEVTKLQIYNQIHHQQAHLESLMKVEKL